MSPKQATQLLGFACYATWSCAANNQPPAHDADDQESTTADRETCEAEEESVREDFQEWQACTKDSDCIIERFDVECVSPFLCGTAHAKSSDPEELQAAVESLVERYKTQCSCADADCVPLDRLVPRCDLTRSLCVVE